MTLIRQVSLLFLSFLFFSSTAFAQTLLKVHFIDVGYGDAILLQTPQGKNILIDSGKDTTAQNVLEFLKNQNVEHIDKAVLTHPHNNHFGGFLLLLDDVSVGEFYKNADENGEEGYSTLLELLALKDLPPKILHRGDHLDLDKVKISVLHPDNMNASTNGNSLVLFVEYKQTHILLTADVEEKQLDQVIKLYPQVLGARVIQIPHHGGTITETMAQNSLGKIFVASTGSNQWGIPLEEKLKELKGKVYRTDKMGSISLHSDGKEITVVTKEVSQ